MLTFGKDDDRNTTPLKKRYFIQEDDQPLLSNENPSVSINQIHHSTTSSTLAGPSDNLQTVASVPDVRCVSDYMNIPNLWNVEIECDDDAVAEAVDIDEREMSSFTSDNSFEIVDL